VETNREQCKITPAANRNGKTKDGTPVEPDENAVNELIEKVVKFVEEIADKLDIK
jgi:hypothetical protein